MKFTWVTFSEDTEINHAGEVLEVEAGTAYKFPLQRAEKLAEGFDAFAGYEEVFEVPEDEVAETVGEEEGEPVDDSDEGGFLESRTVDEVEEAVAEIEDVERLKNLADQAERKGAAEAIASRLDELETEDDEEEEDEEE